MGGRSELTIAMYVPRRNPQTATLALRGLTVHLWRWPGTAPQPIVLLHGWMDTGETFQFLADALPDDYTLIAPDLRGFGRSERASAGYWFPEYLADLDALLDALSPAAPVTLTGHSMGGNIACLYAGARPERVRHIVALEGFGLPRTTAKMAPGRYREWLEQLHTAPSFPSYADWDALTAAIARRHPRLDPERAAFVARAWGERNAAGRIIVRADPAHRRVNPVLYRRDEAEACWSAITAPVLWLVGEHSEYLRRIAEDVTPDRLKRIFRDIRICTISDAGHMLHYERPAEVGREIELFLGDVNGER